MFRMGEKEALRWENHHLPKGIILFTLKFGMGLSMYVAISYNLFLGFQKYPGDYLKIIQSWSFSEQLPHFLMAIPAGIAAGVAMWYIHSTRYKRYKAQEEAISTPKS
jgi:hypothetical protein